MSWLLSILSCVVVCAGCATTVVPPGTNPNASLSLPDILAQAKADVAVLTADSLHGRGYVFGGDRKAARYLRRRFESIGLRPVAGDYYQPFSLETDLFTETPTLTVNGRVLKAGRDFLPLPSTASGDGHDIQHLVLGGSGVVLPQAGVDTYQGTANVQSAVVILDETVPDSIRTLLANWPESLSVTGRVQAAAEQGASAVVFLTDRLIYGDFTPNVSVPVFFVRRSAWPERTRSISFDVRSVRDTTANTQNVLGWLPGTVVPDSFLIVTAHYDHLGSLGRKSYFPGANDNASGVAMLLAIAETLARQPLRYSVLFAAFSGEEEGLIGSRYFAAHSPVDLNRAVFLLNFDMVASGEQGIVAEGGVDFPDRYRMLQQIASGIKGLTLSTRRNSPNSDQYFLIQGGVPGFYLYTNKGKQPYHSIADLPETLEWDDFLQVYQLSSTFLQRLSSGVTR